MGRSGQAEARQALGSLPVPKLSESKRREKPMAENRKQILAAANWARDWLVPLQNAPQILQAVVAAEDDLAAATAQKDAIVAEIDQLVARKADAEVAVEQAEAHRDEVGEACGAEIQNSRAEAEATQTATAELQAQYDELKAAFQQFQKDHGLTAV